MITGRLLLFETNVWVAIDTQNEDNIKALYKPYKNAMFIGSNNQYNREHVNEPGWGSKYYIKEWRDWWKFKVLTEPLKIGSIYDPHITDWDL